MAKRIGEKLHWPVFDREILQEMAGDSKGRLQLYREMDEHDMGCFEIFLHGLLQEEYNWVDYTRKLAETVLGIARQGSAVFVGRGIDLILPKERGYRVRIDAPLETRVARFARERSLDIETARQKLLELDADRARFIRNTYHTEDDALARYDAVLNMAHQRAEAAAEWILQGMRIRHLVP